MDDIDKSVMKLLVRATSRDMADCRFRECQKKWYVNLLNLRNNSLLII